MKSNLLRSIVIASFISVPLISSVISMVHLVDLFMLGNPGIMAKTIAIAIELGAIASFMALSIMGKLNKFFVWAVFIVLFIMQLIGNVYFSFNYVTIQLVNNPNWISSFKEMYEFFFDKASMLDIKMYFSLLIGSVIPIISIFLLKSLTEYLGNDKDEVISSETNADDNVKEETEIIQNLEGASEEFLNNKSDEDLIFNSMAETVEEPIENEEIKEDKDPFEGIPLNDLSRTNSNHVVPAARNIHPAHMM